MENEKLAKIISLDDYRKRNQPRFSDEERDLMDIFRDGDSAAKAQAKEKIENDPTLMVRIIEDKLTDNGYPQESIDRVGHFLEELNDAYPDVPANEISQKILRMFNPSMHLTYTDSEAMSAKIQDAKNRQGRAVLRVVRDADR